LKDKFQIPEIDTSNFKTSLNRTVDLIQNMSEYWTKGCLDIKRRIQRLVFPSGILYNPENRQYLTPEVNQLFVVTSELSRVPDDVKKNSPLI
jgi:site-specific DNA recombinase